MPGPAPKRDAERRRRNKPVVPTESVELEALDDTDPTSLPFLIKQPIIVPSVPQKSVDLDDPESPTVDAWHPIAVEFWESLKRSGQALFWEPSDWMVAKLLCESISRDLNPQVVGVAPASEFGPAEVVRERIPLKGASLNAYLKGFASLMLTEGDRRRLRIELERERLKSGDTSGPGAEVVPITNRRQAKLIASQVKAS